MNLRAFANVPTIIGTTTNELVERIPIYNGLGTSANVIGILEPFHPLVPSNSLQNLLSYYPVQDFQNIGPPLSGAQWSRAVAIENDLEIFCPAYTQAVQQASTMAAVWKCELTFVLLI